MRGIEFQAVVLAAGKGSRMTELTAGKPKCLLPIGNKPMVWYPLKLLEKTGFSEAIIIVSESMRNEVVSCMDKFNFKMKLEILGVPNAEDLGTADSIRHIHEKIYADCLIVSCDLITDTDIAEFLNLYRKHGAAAAAMMFPMPKFPQGFITPGPKNKQRPETDLIGIDNETDRLVFLASASDFEETIEFSRKLIMKHSNITVHSKLLDAHLYVINKWVIDYLVYNKKLSTFKGEVLSYIVKKQLAKPDKQNTDDKNASIVKINIKDDVFRFAVEEPLDTLIREMSAFNDHKTDMKDAYHKDVNRCYAYVTSGKCGLRANTIQMYSLANTMIDKWWKFETEEERSPNISPNATIKCTQMQDCNIDENTFIDEKTSIKQSYIGPNVTIASKTRISQSIVMGNVTIKQKCVIENCILCNGCIIEEGSQLKDCIVGARHTVPSTSQHSREILTEADRLMEI